jgi:catechol 2,3-dioxygenase-like lactoylglutathione lyase family enzyme
MSVSGIGGVFFRADDPGALQEWYKTHLGVVVDFAAPWVPEPGPTLFMAFPRDSDHFPLGKQWMINFRVAKLDETLATLRKAGVAVTTKPEWDTPETGRFAHIHDPEGNQVELWEPPAD